MKKSTLVLFVLLSQVCMGQIAFLEDRHYNKEIDSLIFTIKNGCATQTNLHEYVSYIIVNTPPSNPICAERGHISDGSVLSTCAYCPDYIIDTDSTSILVSPACNTYSYTCSRCKQSVKQAEKETRTIIWKKLKK